MTFTSSIVPGTLGDAHQVNLMGRKRNQSPGFVYVATNDAFPGMCKVGSTKNPKKRLREFNIADPHRSYRFSALRFFKRGYYEAERLIQKALSPTGMEGEWYRVPPEKAVGVLNRLHNIREQGETY